MGILYTKSDDKQKDCDTLDSTLEIRLGNSSLKQVYRSQIKTRIHIKTVYPKPGEAFIHQISFHRFVDGVKDLEAAT